MADLVGGLRDDRPDAASSEVPTNRAGRVGAIRKDDHRASSSPAESAPRDPDSGHDRLAGRRITGLSCGDVDGQRPCPAVAGQEHLRAQATAGASECVVRGLGSAGRPFFSGSGRMLVGPADGGVHRDGPAQVVISIRCGKDRCEDPIPCAVHGPPDQAFARSERVRALLADRARESRCGTSTRWLPRSGGGRPTVVHGPDRPASAARSDPTSHQ
jgi:hypothetical protein